MQVASICEVKARRALAQEASDHATLMPQYSAMQQHRCSAERRGNSFNGYVSCDYARALKQVRGI